jgi:hypothetical protein
MAKVDYSQVVKDMLAAVEKVLKKKWPEIRDYAGSEIKKIAETVAFIERKRADGSMTEEEAKLYLDLQKNSSRAVLAALKGMTLVAAEEAINAALAVLAGVLNKLIGLPVTGG